ncbi:hypothetical protein Bbelb_147000 [Branchiostoma belcheri]|nr:hypothetical protein Bbelb_147000 [Branchiostoma belcheri]
MRRFNISRGIINSIEALYKGSQSTVMTGDEFSECFPTSVGVRQGCLLSPTLCNIFLENIMREALSPLESPVKLAGQIINHLQFADDVDLLDGSKQDQQAHFSSLDSTSRRYGREVSLEKTKCLVTGPPDTVQVTVRGTDLEQVNEFSYLGSLQTADCSSSREKRKLQWFGHATRAKGTLAHTTLQGKAEGGRLRGRPRRTWTSDLKEWTGHPLSHLTSLAENRPGWITLVDSLVAPTAGQTAMGPDRDVRTGTSGHT